MDNSTAKEILSAYRPGGEDAKDPFFREALAQCEHDPEMKRWFYEQRVFDERVAASLENIRAPESGKRAILALAKTESTSPSTEPSFWRRRGAWYALAATLAIAFVSTVGILQKQAPVSHTQTQSLTEMVAAAMPLEFRHADAARVLNWLNDRGAPVPTVLAAKITDTLAAGCRIFTTPEGGTVSLVCLEVDHQLVHVFIYDQQAAKYFKEPINQWWRENGYNLIATENAGQLVAIATRASPETIQYLL